MKAKWMIFGMLFLALGCKKTEDLPATVYDCSLPAADSSATHPRALQCQALLDDMTHQGVVGVQMAVHDPARGLWLGASGKADLHNEVAMKPCNLTRVGSTVKTFTATVLFLLQEEGKLDLDDKLADHLHSEHLAKIPNAEIATLRQCLQHSSGIYNYIWNLRFQTASLNDLIRPWDADDLLQFAHNQGPNFAPGEDVSYSNTNYILLGLMIEEMEGKPLHQVFEERIFAPVGMSSTLFAGKNPVPSNIARGYVDIYSNLNVMESTYYSGWDYYTADGGLISNAHDMCLFFRSLHQGEILGAASLAEMLTWQTAKETDPAFFPIQYGLGIFRIETPKGVAYMHSGDAIGYYANMLYFPADSTTIVYAVNSNYGKIDAFVSTREAMEKVMNAAMD
jgi:D-alanyl-D-alanine carboxypeptidase